ncbi:helix-turn-helix domain-containing protein [Streptosporangium roseum]|uniref:helix-turn-helix domain-containing protein n=1 Tax=Streptosporangium roseum TaxID=2001 RepID=UPI000AF6818F|nr:helix-turn-helix domain-containing protein [Streptosporangium roseum]
MSEDERAALARRAESPDRRVAERARIVLACAEGISNAVVARKIGVAVKTAAKWRRQFAEQRLAGLADAGRIGRPKADLDLKRDRLYGHIKPIKKRTQFLEFCRYLRTLYPPEVRIAIVCDNFSPHLTTKRCQRVGAWAAASNVEIAYTPTDSSWLNRIEAQFTALRYFALDGTDHANHKEQGSMIRRYMIWRSRHADDRRLRAVVAKANVA